MKIAVINLTSNTQFLTKIKEYFSKYEVAEYANLEEYNKYLLGFKVHPLDYESFGFEDYKNSFELVLFVTNGAKRKVKNNLLQNTFIPIRVFVIDENKEIEIQLKDKIAPVDFQWFYEKFMFRFHSLLKEYSPNNDNFSQIIKQCPFCKSDQFFFTHDYSKNNTTGCHIDFKCSSCGNILSTETMLNIMDAVYKYNPKIKTYLNEYVKISTIKKSISDKIENEIDKTKTISLL